MHPRILSGIEKLRALACEEAGEDVPLRVLSGGRCGPHNRAIGGHPNSQHMRGCATDVQSRNPKVSNAQLAALAFDVPEFCNGGIGINENTLHLDVGKRTTWFYTDKAEKLFKDEVHGVTAEEAAEAPEPVGPPTVPPQGLMIDPTSPLAPAPTPKPAPKKPIPKKKGGRR